MYQVASVHNEEHTRLPLPPFPRGWFAVAFSHEVPKASTKTLSYLGHTVVLTRDDAGELQGSYFPGVYPQLVETHGTILHFVGTESHWDAPCSESEGWSSPRCQRWLLDTHPQEILENTVDTAHFRKVHGYESLEIIQPIHFDGPIMRAMFEVTRVEGLLGKWDRREIQMQLDIEASGLGYSKVEIHIPQLALQVRQVVMPTPVMEGGVELFATTQVKHLQDISAIPQIINRLVPRKLIAELLAMVAARGMANDVEQDFAIWENKRYLNPPLIVRNDGPIGHYRKWASQFYNPSGLSLPTLTHNFGEEHVH